MGMVLYYHLSLSGNNGAANQRRHGEEEMKLLGVKERGKLCASKCMHASACVE
jgi:hypothetical protein